MAGEQPGGEVSQVVQVLAGVVEARDLGCGGEVLAGEIPDPGGAVAEDDGLADVLDAAAAGLGGEQDAELRGGLECGQAGCGGRVADGLTVFIEPGLGEQAG